MTAETKKRELQRLADTFRRLATRPAPTPSWRNLLPKEGERVTYLRAGRIRRGSGVVIELAPPPLLAARVEPANPNFHTIWVSLTELANGRKEPITNAA